MGSGGPSLRRRGAGRLIAASLAGAAIAPLSRVNSEERRTVTYSSGWTDAPSTYWEMLRPDRASGKPTVVMVPGGAHTAACYLTTADGRPGWAHDFVGAGYPVLLVDWPGTGRSGYAASEALTGDVVCAGLAAAIATVAEPVVLMTHSMSGAYGWKLLEQLGTQVIRLVAVAPAPPGNIQPRPEVVSETAEQIEIRGTTNYVLDRKAPFVSSPGFVRSKLIGNSSQFPPESAVRYAASLIPIPPRLLQQRLNIDGSQLRIGNLAAYAGKPVLVVTGTDDVDHPRSLDAGIVDWLRQSGATGEHLYLAEKGITGNGHMMMLEGNSREIATAIMERIAG